MAGNKRPNENAQYIAERRTVDVLRALKEYSDERHPVIKKDLLEKVSTTDNDQTLSDTVDEILMEINPLVHTDDNDAEYRIKYDGYDKPFEENPLVIKETIGALRNELRRKDADKEAIKHKISELGYKKAPAIKGLRYIHDFSYEDMDRLIGAVALSAGIAPGDKERLIGRIMDTSSRYYKSPFFDRALGKLKFNPYSEYSRLHSRTGVTEKRIGENVQILQNAMRQRTKVRFHFDCYSADKTYVSDDVWKVISPYYIVVYNDNYYVIGAWDTGTYACHYRIDLMSSVEVITDEENKPVQMRSMSDIKDLPGRDMTWDPEKYMSEHLYMAFETDKNRPRDISIRIPLSYKNRYTILHDWFGDHFRINKKATADSEEGYEVVDVRTSPSMLAHWAMQYSDFCEILDDEVREDIRKEMKKLERKYKR
ncbi:MAG: WYL domain-containing protein [Lachnospiraceae bacterium]|nr:WYL domain-containing protein [Lachnospiraceae bacterium]